MFSQYGAFLPRAILMLASDLLTGLQVDDLVQKEQYQEAISLIRQVDPVLLREDVSLHFLTVGLVANYIPQPHLIIHLVPLVGWHSSRDPLRASSLPKTPI